MKKLYAGIAAAALTATGIACTAGAAHAEGTWPSVYNLAPTDGGSASLALSATGTAAYAAWVDGTDANTIDIATTTLATGETTSVQRVSTDENVIFDAAATSQGMVVALGSPGGSGSPDILVRNVGGGFNGITLDALDGADSLAVSPDGDRVAVAGTDSGLPSVTLVDISTGSPVAESTTVLPGVEWANVSDLTVNDAGSTYVVGSSNLGNRLWTVNADASTSSLQFASGNPESVAVLSDGTVAVGLESETGNLIAYAGGTGPDGPVDVDGPVNHLFASGQTLWATDGSSQLTRIEGTSAQTLGTGYGEIWNAAASADGATLYVLGASWLPDQDTSGPASLFAMTAPSAPTDLNTWANSDTVGVSWTPADGTAGDDYRITLTDQAPPYTVVSTTQFSDNPSSINVIGTDPTHRYDVKVEAFNGAFYSTALTGTYLPAVPGEGVVTVTGAAAAGSTLAGHLAGTWPSTATVTYQWLASYSNGESGGLEPIPNATGTTLALTPDLVGKYVALQAQAHLDTYTDAFAGSDPVKVLAAPAVQPPATTPPAQVTTVKPATVKANAKKLKLTLSGLGAVSATGKVKVYNGKKLVGTAKIVNGKLVVKLKKHLSHGKHKLKLKYAGSAQVAKFTKKVKIKVK